MAHRRTCPLLVDDVLCSRCLSSYCRDITGISGESSCLIYSLVIVVDVREECTSWVSLDNLFVTEYSALE